MESSEFRLEITILQPDQGCKHRFGRSELVRYFLVFYWSRFWRFRGSGAVRGFEKLCGAGSGSTGSGVNL